MKYPQFSKKGACGSHKGLDAAPAYKTGFKNGTGMQWKKYCPVCGAVHYCDGARG